MFAKGALAVFIFVFVKQLQGREPLAQPRPSTSLSPRRAAVRWDAGVRASSFILGASALGFLKEKKEGGIRGNMGIQGGWSKTNLVKALLETRGCRWISYSNSKQYS